MAGALPAAAVLVLVGGVLADHAVQAEVLAVGVAGAAQVHGQHLLLVAVVLGHLVKELFKGLGRKEKNGYI